MAIGDVYRAQIQLPYVGVFDGSDVAEHDLHFVWQGVGTDPNHAAFVALTDRIADFYNLNVTETGFHVEHFLSQRITRDLNGAFVNFYKLPAAPGDSGPPVDQTVFTLRNIGIGAAALPEQLCVACSIHGDLAGIAERAGTTRPKARRRGRFFLGPLNIRTLGSTTAEGHREVDTNFVVTLSHACSRLVGDPITTPFALVVFSRTDWAGHAVTGGWVDDHFDVQRRRADPTRNKNLWGSAP